MNGEEIQGFVRTFNDGLGQKMLRWFILLVLVGSLFGVYAWTQFKGLDRASAMEYSHLGHQLALGRGFSTRCIRPADLWYLNRRGRFAVDRRESPDRVTATFPDIRHGPGYPALLSVGLRLMHPRYDVSMKPGGVPGVFDAEKKVIVPMGILFSMLAGLFLFLMARMLFGDSVAWVSVILYLTTDSVLAGSISGTPESLLCMLAATGGYSVLIAVRASNGSSILRWLVPLAVSGVVCGLAVLTCYSMVILPLVLGAFWFWTSGAWWDDEQEEHVPVSGTRRWAGLVTMLAVAALIVTPWLIRNSVVSGGILGSAPYEVLEGAGSYGDTGVDRNPEPGIHALRVVAALKQKAITNLLELYDNRVLSLGSGLAMCLFLASLFRVSERDEVTRFRWCVLGGLVLVVVAVAMGGSDCDWLLGVLLPFIIVFGVAFFVEILIPQHERDLGWASFALWILIILTALPAAARIIAVRPSIPYPPYYPAYIKYVSGLLDEDEVLCTDMPWATAWYGDRASILLPTSPAGFKYIHGKYVPISGLYLTPLTGSGSYRDVFNLGVGSSWLSVLNGRVEEDFPLKEGISLPAGSRDQVFLTDFPRWPVRKAAGAVEKEPVN